MSHAIPQEYVEFCKAVARLCKEHEVEHLTARFRPDWRADWHSEIDMTFQQGRHGIDNDQVSITSTVRIWTKTTPAERTEQEGSNGD